jgi:RND family efflux transporter MFP subunit
MRVFRFVVAGLLPATMALAAGTAHGQSLSAQAAGAVPSAAPIAVQVVARSTAPLAAPMSGQLVVFPAQDGDAVEQGAEVARFNCAQQEAMRLRAHAELVKRQDLLGTQQALKSLNAYSKADFAAARNDVEVAKAELGLAQTAVDNCVLKAPFRGRVASTSVRNFQYVQAGAPLLDLVDERDLELELVVSSMLLVWLKTGADVQVHISETQRDYEATIIRISGRVDAASQTIKVYGRIVGDAPALLPGMSGVARFPSPPG